METTTSFFKGLISIFLCELQGWVLQRKNVAFPFLKMFLTKMIDIQVFLEPIISYEMCLKRFQCAQMSTGENK